MKPKVLLVEDDPKAVILVNRLFKKRLPQVEVSVASDGAQALEYLMGPEIGTQKVIELPLLVLLDLDLPKVHGFEVLKKLRSHRNTMALPVVILTADRQMDATTGYILGANSFMHKPLDFDKFSQILVQLGLGYLQHPAGERNN